MACEPSPAASYNSWLGLTKVRILLAKLHLDYICGLKSDRAIKKAMAELPTSVYATYDEVLQQLCDSRPSEVDEMRIMLQWLVYSEVPLTLRQIAEIVSIQADDCELDESGIATDVLDLAACLGSLVTLHTEDTTANRYPDLRGPYPTVIMLAHYSVEEYFKSGEIAPELVARFPMDPMPIHRQCAELCLQYIKFKSFEEPLEMV